MINVNWRDVLKEWCESRKTSVTDVHYRQDPGSPPTLVEDWVLMVDTSGSMPQSFYRELEARRRLNAYVDRSIAEWKARR
jgi:hypothetical protein